VEEKSLPKMVKSKKCRLDLFLVEQGLCASREQAQRAVMAGEVKIGDQIISKSSVMVEPGTAVSLQARSPYVGRGGTKLEGALDHFEILAQGLTALDLGASTGGFTDCLLQRGAAKVYAIDVGHGQLAWKIRNDPRVVVREKLNARYLTREDIPEKIDLCVIDVSFISLTLILSNAFDLVTPNGVILALIKPQFELQAADVAHGGIVRDPALHEKAQNKIRDFVVNAGHNVTGMVRSGITGADGNQEFFICVRRKSV
jgi:23S rRNA (cytidine1920-2'-O)/16S rRNA (cytidine1409-2'-O)-methyltransferase